MAGRVGVVGQDQLGAGGVRAFGDAWPGDWALIDAAGPAGGGGSTGQPMDEAVDACDLVLVDLGPTHRALTYRLALQFADRGVPAYFLLRDGDRVRLVPQRPTAGGPCYLCFTLRELACRDDFHDVLIGDARGEPAPAGAADPDLGWQATRVGRRLAGWIARPAPATLAFWDTLVELDITSHRERSHWFATHPRCPRCGDRAAPGANAAAARPRARSGTRRLVSHVCGIIRDVSEERFAGTHLAYARGSNPHLALGGVRQAGTGCATDPAGARAAAIGEAIERYSAAIWRPAPGELSQAPPVDASCYEAEQLTGLPPAGGGMTGIGGYLRVPSLLHRMPGSVPAPLVGVAAAPAPWSQVSTSNGVAAHTSRAAAISHGLAELIERDAFLLTWWARLPVVGYLPSSHPDPAVQAILAELARIGVTVRLFRLPAAIGGQVFLSVALMEEWDHRAARVAVGLGCHLDPVTAAAKAVLESVMVWRELSRRLADQAIREFAGTTLADPRRITRPAHHALHYAARADLTALEFLLRQPAAHRLVASPAQTGRPAGPDRDGWLRQLRSAGYDVLCLDLTPAHLAAVGWYACRLIVPGCLPLVHSGTLVPLRLPRLRVALAGGDRDAGLPPQAANPDPHPLA